MPQLNVICHLERLHPVYIDKRVHFVLNLGLAYENASMPATHPDNFVKPWLAGTLGISVYGFNVDGKPPVEIARVVSTPSDASPKVVRNAFESAFALTTSADWIAPAGTAREPREISESKRNWLAFQWQQARLPGGIAAAANLAVYFHCLGDDLKQFRFVAAAPVLGPDGFFKPTALGPKPPLKPVDDVKAELARQADGSLFWAYDKPPKDIDSVSAFLNSCEWNADPPADGFLDLKTLWVKVQTPASRNWTLEFESRASDAFALPSRLLEALAQQQSTLPSWIATFHAGFFSALKAVLNTGAALAPDGTTLAASIAAASGIPADLDTLRRFERQLAIKQYAELIGATAEFDSNPQPGGPLPDYLHKLSALNTRLMRQDDLAQAIAALWQAALNLTGADRDKVVAAAANTLQLYKRLALGNLGAHWAAISDKLNSKADVEAWLLSRLLNEASATMTSVPSPVHDYLAAFSQRFVAETLVPEGTDFAKPQTSPEELVVQVADLQRAAPDQNDENESLRRVAGVGVLLRHGARPYSCLNFTIAKSGGDPVTMDPIAFPSQIQFRAGLRRAHVSYNNHPLIAPDRSQDLARRGQFVSDTGSQGKALFDLESPYGFQTLPLEGLFYTRVYDVAAFIFGAGGNVPAEIAREGNPSRLDLAKLATDSVPSIPYTYLRKFPVGAVRIGNQSSVGPQSAQPDLDLSVPPIPANVHPLARAICPEAKSTPLVLLTPPEADRIWDGAAQFRFAVRPPSVPTSIWYRAAGPGVDGTPTGAQFSREECGIIIGTCGDLNDVGPGDGPDRDKGTKDDSTLDDPMVAQIEFRLESIDRDGKPMTKDVKTCVLIRNPSKGPLAKAQSLPRTVLVKSVDAATPAAIQPPGADSLVIQVPPGLWSLRVRPVVGDPSAFDPALRDALEGTKKDVEQFGAREMFIEVASDWPRITNETRPQALARLSRALHSALVPRTDETGASAVMTARLELTSQDLSSASPLFQRCDVLLQKWRWDGRPPFSLGGDGLPHFGFPLTEPFDDTKPYREDAVLFGSRLATDREEIPKQLNATSSALKELLVFSRDFGSVPAAMYFRIGVRVHSRYEGLMRRGATIESVTDDGADIERWRRVLVRCRWTGVVPKPAVKLAVPLAQTWQPAAPFIESQPLGATHTPALADPSNPGLLIVLDEPWYGGSFGLAEYLESSIEDALLPDVPLKADSEPDSDDETSQAGPGDTRPEFGPDPIVALPSDPFEGKSVTMPAAVGAIGYTFDTDTMAPEWVKAAFYQPPPVVGDAEDSQPDLTWYFAKLRFRRTLADAAVSLTSRPASLQSDWTEGVWAQFLPPSDRLFVSDDKEETGLRSVAVRDLLFDPVERSVRNRDSGEAAALVATPADEGGKCRFALYGLLTREVADVAGRRGQEALVPGGLFQWKNGIPGVTPSERLRLRILEIQYRDGEDPGDDLPARLFNANAAGPTDVLARIVRISLPLANTMERQ